MTATVLKTDAETDLAILRADHAGPYDSLPLSEPAGMRALAETSQVVVFGFPLGGALAVRENTRPEPSVTSSRIMSLRHDRGELQLIQLDGSINHGNSGGPVVDERGKVIGIIAAGISGAAISFAIPANRVGPLLLASAVKLTSRTQNDATAAFDEVLAESDAKTANLAAAATAPDDAARKSAEQVVHELFAPQFADKTPKGKRALAAALLARGVATTDDPVGCYELLNEAANAAADAGDLDTAMKATGELGSRYAIDAEARSVTILTQLAPKLTSPVDSALLAGYGLVVARAMVRDDRFTDVERIIPIVRKAATASYSVQVQKTVRDKLASVDASCKQFRVAEPAIIKLKTEPNDPEANLTVGRFECFAMNDFDKGLPLLAKGSDPTLKSASMADLAKPSDAPACKLVGDKWWDQGAKETKDAAAAEQCKSRAGYWYRLAVGELDGLTKTLVEQRLSTLPPAGDVASAASPGTPTVQLSVTTLKLSAKNADGSDMGLLQKGKYTIEITGQVHLHFDEPAFIVGPQGREFAGHIIGTVTVELGGKVYDSRDNGRDIENGRAIDLQVGESARVTMKINDLTYDDNSGAYDIKIIRH